MTRCFDRSVAVRAQEIYEVTNEEDLAAGLALLVEPMLVGTLAGYLIEDETDYEKRTKLLREKLAECLRRGLITDDVKRIDRCTTFHRRKGLSPLRRMAGLTWQSFTGSML